MISMISFRVSRRSLQLRNFKLRSSMTQIGKAAREPRLIDHLSPRKRHAPLWPLPLAYVHENVFHWNRRVVLYIVHVVVKCLALALCHACLDVLQNESNGSSCHPFCCQPSPPCSPLSRRTTYALAATAPQFFQQ